MAELVGLVSGLAALSTFAFEATKALYQTIKSFENQPRAVRDLNEEVDALNRVLRSLTDTANKASDIDLSALDYPLERCGNACTEFGKMLLKVSSRSGGTRASFRAWAQLKYRGDSIDDFRQMLASYKSTIIIALTDAQLRKSYVGDENIQEYKEMVKSTTVDLEARMEIIDAKIDAILGRTVAKSDLDDVELEEIREERLATQKCLEICAQVSNYIRDSQVRARLGDTGPAVRIGSERITLEALQECTDTISVTTARLERQMQKLIKQVATSSTVTVDSEGEAAELAELQEDWESARRCKGICSEADKNITIVENYAASDDALQFVVSTNGKVIHGKNRGEGRNTRQVGGYLSDQSLQQLSRDMVRIALHSTEDHEPPSGSDTPPVSDAVQSRSVAEFRDRWGQGHKLSPKSTDDNGPPSSSQGLAKGGANS